MSDHDRKLAAFLLGQLSAQPPESFTRALASMLRDAKDSHAPTSPALLNAEAGTSSENGSPEASTEHPGGAGGDDGFDTLRRAAVAARKELAGAEYEGDAVDDLAALLDSAGARVSFDRGRNNRHPCTFCGKTPSFTADAHQLLTIGRYLDGSELTRPVCDGCRKIADVRMNTDGVAQEAREKDWQQYISSKNSKFPETERDTFAFAWAAGAASGEWRNRAKDAEQRLVEANSEIDRLNPFDRGRKNPFPLANESLPTDPAARFIDVIRYYVGMLEDGDNWSHSLGHIQECCKEFEAAIESADKAEQAADRLPATIAQAVVQAVEAGVDRAVLVAAPVPMLLSCPACSAPHVDEGEWATRPHKTHLCAWCRHQWRPFDYATVGVTEAPSL